MKFQKRIKTGLLVRNLLNIEEYYIIIQFLKVEIFLRSIYIIIKNGNRVKTRYFINEKGKNIVRLIYYFKDYYAKKRL